MKDIEFFFPNWKKESTEFPNNILTFINRVLLEKLNFYAKNTKKYYVLKTASRSIFWSSIVLSIISLTGGLGTGIGISTDNHTISIILGITAGVLQILAWPAFFARRKFAKSWKHNFTAFESLKLSYNKFAYGSLKGHPKEFMLECEEIINRHNYWKNNKIDESQPDKNKNKK